MTQANIGDQITVRRECRIDDGRHGVIIGILGDDGGPPYLVRWLDDYESRIFPSADAVIAPHQAT